MTTAYPPNDWTSEADNELARLWNGPPLTAWEIARRISIVLCRPITKNAILGRVRRLREKGIEMVQKGPTRARTQTAAAKLPGDIFPGKGECNWPIGDPRDLSFHFCRARRGSHDLYCDAHFSVAYRKPDKER